MRLIAILLVLLSIDIASAQINDSSVHVAQIQAGKGENDKKLPAPNQNPQVVTASQSSNENQPSSKWSDPITWLTLLIALATVFLWVSTRRLAQEAERSRIVAEQTANAVKQSADASVKAAMPVLFPYVLQASDLHPLVESDLPIDHEARILIGFDNYGKTPGIIRRVNADLVVTLKDSLPEPTVCTLHDYAGVIIPGDSRAYQHHFGALDLVQTIKYSPQELKELLAEARGEFRRIALLGEVTYDDFFGFRHTSRFCVKLRLLVEHSPTTTTFKLFQLAKGGSKYNAIESVPIPNPDPLV